MEYKHIIFDLDGTLVDTAALIVATWDRNKTLVVGDMNVDILMGNRAGTSTCGVTYDNGSAEDLRPRSPIYVKI